MHKLLAYAVAGVVFTRAAQAEPTTRLATTALSSDAPTRMPTTMPTSTPASITLVGYLAPVDAQEVKPKLKRFTASLTVTQIVAQGAAVKIGTPLIAFDLTELDQDILDAASEVEVAKANLTKTESDGAIALRADAAALEQRTDDVADAERNAAWWRDVEGPDYLKRIDENVRDAQDKVDDANDELDQLRKMYKSEELTNATADIVVKRAVRNLEELKRQLEILRRTGDQKKATEYQDKAQEFGRVLDAAKRGFDDGNAGLAQAKVTRASTLMKAKTGVRDAQKKLSELEEDKLALDIKSTHDGVAFIGGFDKGAWQGSAPDAINVGDKIDASKPMVTVIQPGKLKAIAKLGEAEVFRVKPGQSARLKLDALPDGKFIGTLGTRGAIPVDGSFEQIIEIKELDARLVPGMKVSVELDAEAK